jgi:phosphoribosylanthranilate isomerase
MTKVKICGIKTYDDALAASTAGADMLGFNFFKRTPRYVDPEDALAICERLRAELGEATPMLVGLFVNEGVGRISMTLEKVGLRAAQLSGDESADLLRELRGIGFKAIRPRSQVEALEDAAYFLPHSPTEGAFPSLLLDAFSAGQYGGTGHQANIETVLALKAIVPRLMVAGGLTPDKVGELVHLVKPWGVDVASGVEGDTPGLKDHGKVRAFIQAAKAASEN